MTQVDISLIVFLYGKGMIILLYGINKTPLNQYSNFASATNSSKDQDMIKFLLLSSLDSFSNFTHPRY